jgi:hypothetical protein
VKTSNLTLSMNVSDAFVLILRPLLHEAASIISILLVVVTGRYTWRSCAVAEAAGAVLWGNEQPLRGVHFSSNKYKCKLPSLAVCSSADNCAGQFR